MLDQRIIDLEPYFKDYNYVSSNDLMNYGYKIFRLIKTEKVELIITDVQMNKKAYFGPLSDHYYVIILVEK